MTNTHIRTALIIGCNGTFGSSTGQELLKQGWRVKALVRNKNKQPDWLNAEDVVIGNCEQLQDVTLAATDVDLIVYAANPLYHQWHKKAMKMLEPTVQVAEKRKLHILFPGNVYGYNPLTTPMIDENSPTDAVTDKGQIRNKMEQRLKRASVNGATVTLIRAGDFIAKGADSSWINHMLSKRKNGWTLANPSPEGHKHNYAYLPDLAANAVALIDIDKSGYNEWNEPGVVASHQDWLSALTLLGLNIKSTTLPWWAFKLLGLVLPPVREAVKMRYLWQQPLLLDGKKMRAALGEKYSSTPLVDISRVLTGE
ncbi:MAG: NAD(P)H-binding protein [Algicola sp.]|nr:NAD(P)H-binding protein [Algicola sp.]